VDAKSDDKQGVSKDKLHKKVHKKAFSGVQSFFYTTNNNCHIGYQVLLEPVPISLTLQL
jgi:hypothetical protein